MYAVRQRGDDLAAFVLAANQDGHRASEDAPRKASMNARNELRRQIRTRFSTQGRVWAARGFAASIHVRKMDEDWWSVIDRSVYSKKRSQPVSLAWVFDQAPMIRGKRGWVAVPIKGQAPIHRNGRRYAWPSEAAADGWELEVTPIMGKNLKLILGRLNRLEPWRPLYFYIPPYRASKRLDLDSLWRKHAASMDRLWAEAFDRRMANRARKRAA